MGAGDPGADRMAAPSSLVSTKATAPAPERSSNAVPGPGTTASDATTTATRALPAPTASAALTSASSPACAEPAAERAARLGRQADGRREERVARTLGERGPGGAPPQAVDDVGLEAGGGERPQRGVGREREHVLVGRADGGLAPTPLRPQAAATSEAGRRHAGAAAPTASKLWHHASRT